jgi:hypothetical protein
MSRQHSETAVLPPVRLKLRFRRLDDELVMAYAEPRVIARDPRSAEWRAFEE